MPTNDGMSFGYVLAACAFALIVGGVVACVDRWRDARLKAVPQRTVPRRRPARPDTVAEPGTHRRAA